jgi:hypothetical protein
LTFAWFERAALRGLDVRPSFAAEELAASELSFRHIVYRGDDQ